MGDQQISVRWNFKQLYSSLDEQSVTALYFKVSPMTSLVMARPRRRVSPSRVSRRVSPIVSSCTVVSRRVSSCLVVTNPVSSCLAVSCRVSSWRMVPYCKIDFLVPSFTFQHYQYPADLRSPRLNRDSSISRREKNPLKIIVLSRGGYNWHFSKSSSDFILSNNFNC